MKEKSHHCFSVKFLKLNMKVKEEKSNWGNKLFNNQEMWCACCSDPNYMTLSNKVARLKLSFLKSLLKDYGLVEIISPSGITLSKDGVAHDSGKSDPYVFSHLTNIFALNNSKVLLEIFCQQTVNKNPTLITQFHFIGLMERYSMYTEDRWVRASQSK